VQLRGWDFPHVSARSDILRGTDWIGQDSDWSGYIEVWRAYLTGQFIDLAGFFEDWADEDTFGRTKRHDWQPCQSLHIEHIIYRYTEIFEFAARWAMTEAGDSEMHVSIEAHGLKDRVLAVYDPRRLGFLEEHVAHIDEWKHEISVSREELVATSREKAQQASASLLMRFGWEPPLEAIADWQQQLIKR
jgi:hypothetical protein